MVLELGILMSGSEETRLRRLGCEIRLIAEGIHHTTEGGMGTSWVCWHKARAWAELEPDGGFRIVVYTIFIGGELEEYCSHGELFTVDDVIEHVDSLDFGLYVVDYGPLEELAAIRDQLLVPYDGEKGSKN
jgi:hypothetical protein